MSFFSFPTAPQSAQSVNARRCIAHVALWFGSRAVAVGVVFVVVVADADADADATCCRLSPWCSKPSPNRSAAGTFVVGMELLLGGDDEKIPVAAVLELDVV